jgi:hypothetical protein
MCQELERMIKWRCLQKRELGTGGRPLPPDSVSGISESVLANTVSQAKGLSHERLLERIYQMWPSNQDTAETHETSEGPMEMLSPEGSKSTSMKKQMCQLCIKEPGRMQCPSCHNAWYCSKRCLEAAQYSHVFKCAGRAITTADYLVLACHDDLFPNDEETNRDFGFGNCVTPQEKSNLMGLYIGLVTRVGITGAELYAWQKTGSLAEKICETYEEAFKRQPHAYRGEYYPWFLKNKHIVTQVGTKSGDRLTDTMDAQSQFYLQSDRNIPYNHLPETKRDVAAFYGIIQMGWHPGPGDGNGLWMAFGFCTLKHESEENEFAKFYRELFKRAPFVSFHEAYLDGSLEKLARRVGLEDIVDAWVKRGAAIGLKPGTPRSSVYDLKEFVLSKFDQVDPEASVIVDYGYANCRDPRERELWKTVYSKLFMTGACDLNELHEACIKGRLYEYVKEVRPDTPRSFERLAKNLYPLPEY